MANGRNFKLNNRKTPAIIVSLLLSLVGFLIKKGITRNIAFVLVFSIFDFLLLIFVKKRLEALYGNARAIKIFVYGVGIILLLIFILLIFGIN